MNHGLRIDDLMLADTIMWRRDTGNLFAMTLEQYNDMYLIVATSRRCNDGCEVNRVLLVSGVAPDDGPTIYQLYAGDSYA